VIVDTVTLTPEDAGKILAISEGQVQRNLKPSVVARITHAIQSGQWRTTHQAIALDSDGRIVDGQHRLAAIVRAGVPVEVQLARDVPREAFDVIDTGSPRTPGDILRIAGFDNGGALAASTRVLLMYDAVVGTTDAFNTHRGTFTTADILRVAHSDRGRQLDRALTPARTTGIALGRMGYSSWLAVLIVLLAEAENVNPDIAIEYLAALREGVNLSAGSPILAVRRHLSSDMGLVRSTRMGERAQVGLAMTIKAFNRWVVGDSSTLVTFKLGVERMPKLVGP